MKITSEEERQQWNAVHLTTRELASLLGIAPNTASHIISEINHKIKAEGINPLPRGRVLTWRVKKHFGIKF